MTATRENPTPVRHRTLQVIGDTHIGATLQNRLDRVTADVKRPGVPQVDYRFQVGDLCGTVADSYYTTARAFMDGLGGTWFAGVGNHDVDGRSAEAAAALMGIPAPNYTVDLGYAVLVVFYVRCQGHGSQPAPDYAWLDAQLTAHADRVVIVAGHGPLVYAGVSNPNIAPDYEAILAVLDTHPCVKIYIAGHIHSDIRFWGVQQVISTGSRNIAHLIPGAIYNVTPGTDWFDPLFTAWLTVWDDRLEIRWREHNKRQWVGAGPRYERVWTYTY